MNLAINTDFLGSTGDPAPRLKAIADAGFTHLHWCHQWCTDFFYTPPELHAIAAKLKEYGLTLMDIHGSAGQEKCWFDLDDSRRKAGVLLVKNRLQMLERLGGIGVLMMHIPIFTVGMPEEMRAQHRLMLDRQERSLDELMPVLEKQHAVIAVENGFSDTFESIRELTERYPAERFGITYDSGHGNIAEHRGLELLAPLRRRIQALHLNDNDTSGDQHQPLFYGTVDWNRMAEILADSGYGRPLSFELAMRNTPFYDKALESKQKPESIRAFLNDAHERCLRFADMYEQKKKQGK